MTAVKKFRKKPVVVEAMGWDGKVENAHPVIQWINATDSTANWHEEQRFEYPPRHLELKPTFKVIPAHISIRTLEGTMMATAGDIIIRGVQGEFYPCKPDIFAATYEEVTA